MEIKDAVQILPELEADPRFNATHPSLQAAWTKPMAPFICAIHKQNLPMLRQLLNYQQSSFTMQERLQSARSTQQNDEGTGPHILTVMALLLPEATFPDSATHDLCDVAGDSTLEGFSFLPDTNEHSIVDEEELWHYTLSGIVEERTSKIRALLTGGGTIKIMGAILKGLHASQGRVGEVLSLLLQHCKAEMTEDLVDSISYFRDSPQIARIFEATAHRLDPFTPRQLLWALRFRSAETAAYFLQRQDGNASDTLTARLPES